MRKILVLFCAILLLTVQSRTANAQGEISPEKVLKSIRRGRLFLISQQQADGSWNYGGGNSHKIGVTGLAVLALINSGLTSKDTAVRKGLDFLRRQPISNHTYDASLTLMALAAARDKTDLHKIQTIAAKLESGQIKRGNNSGSWDYSLTGQTLIGGDRSNAQFAILALRDAVHAGAKVKRETWQRARDHWTSQRNGDGSWGYSGRGSAGRGSMTVAGIATMVITGRMLQDNNGQLDCCKTPKRDRYLEDAVNWLARAFARQRTVVNNPGMRSNLLYYMYGLERAGRLSGRRFFGKYDWYRQGAEFLVDRNRRNGSWTGVGHGENDPIVATSFGLLFLSKGLAPVLINKLKYGPPGFRNPDEVGDKDWNRHPNDARNLTEFISGKERWPKLLTWQTVEMRKLVKYGGDRESLDQAKVLLITGGESPKTLLDIQRYTILKNYIKRGGFIFIVGNCKAKSAFDAGVKELISKMFPNGEAELKRLQPDHPIYRSEYQLFKTEREWQDIELYGVDFGCRTAIVYAPVMPGGFDISCLWSKWMIQDPPRPNRIVKQMILKSMKIGVNVIAYATGREPPQKLRKLSPKSEKGRNDKLARGFLQVAKLKHTGDWNVAPRALRELLMGLNRVAGLTATTSPKHNRPLFANDKNLFKYPVVYMHGRSSFTLSPPERAQLLKYLKDRGGLLFADACCGSREFDLAFRKLMTELFPDKKFKRIPIKHELFTRKVGYDISKVKRRAPETTNKNVQLKTNVRTVEPFLEGIEIDGRLVVIYSKYDISCALEQQSSIACAGYVRKDALKIAINILMYSMLQDIRYSDLIQ
ncbi:MAG: DUF4159 domain-containing protein [Planctomycetaceae bacterium]